MALDEGWVYLEDLSNSSNNMKVLCEDWDYDEKCNPEIEDLPGDSRYGINLEVYSRIYKIKGVYFTSHTDWNTFKENLKDWNSAGIKLKIQRTTGGSYATLDSDGNTDVSVFYVTGRGFKKTYKGNATFYRVSQVLFRQKE